MTEEQVRARHEQEVAAFEGSEERQAAHILLEVNEGTTIEQATEKLNGLRQRLDAGETFEALAADYSQDPGSSRTGGNVGYSSGDAFPEPFEQALQSLEVGQVSEPVVTDSGVHLVKLLDIRVKEAPSLDENYARIELALQREAAENVFVEKIDELADQTFTAPDLTQASEMLGLPIQQASIKKNSLQEGLLSSPVVRAAAFNPELMESAVNSRVLELGDSRVMVLRVTGHQPAALQALEAVKEAVARQAKEAAANEEMQAVAMQLKEALSAGGDVESVALEAGYPWQVQLAANRFGGNLPPAIQARAFALPAPAAGQRVIDIVAPSVRETMVMEVSGVEDGSMAGMSAEEVYGIQQYIASEQARVLLALWRDKLKQDADIQYQ